MGFTCSTKSTTVRRRANLFECSGRFYNCPNCKAPENSSSPRSCACPARMVARQLLSGVGLRVCGLGSVNHPVQCLCRVPDVGCRVQGAGCRLQNAGCRVQGLPRGSGGGRGGVEALLVAVFHHLDHLKEEDSYLRRIDSCITQFKAQGPSRTCHQSKEEAT